MLGDALPSPAVLQYGHPVDGVREPFERACSLRSCFNRQIDDVAAVLHRTTRLTHDERTVPKRLDIPHQFMREVRVCVHVPLNSEEWSAATATACAHESARCAVCAWGSLLAEQELPRS